MSKRKYISVERANIAANKEVLDKQGPLSSLLPVICIEMDNGEELETVLTCYDVLFTAPPVLRYDAHNFEPGDPNAHVWLETDSPIWYSRFYTGPIDTEMP